MTLATIPERIVLQTLSLDCLVDARQEAEQRRLDLAEKVRAVMADLAEIDHELLRRCQLDGGTAIMHPTLDIHIEQTQTLNKREDVLREILTLPLPPQIVSEMVAEEVVTTIKTDAVKIKKYAKAYPAVAEIASRGLVYEVGPPKLIVKDLKPINVTPQREVLEA
jgi:hypothetical protein